MNALIAICYVMLCAQVAGAAMATFCQGHACVNPYTRSNVAICAFALAYFGGFYLLGGLGRALGMRLVVPSIAVMLLLLPASACWLLRRRIVSARGGQAALRRHKSFRPGPTGTCCALAYGLVAVMLVSGYPQGFEVMAYHLPGAVAILQSHTLNAWDGNFPHMFPANAGIYYAFLLAALPEKVVSAANLLFLIPLYTGVAGTGMLVGADRKAAGLSVCGLLSVPMVAFSAAELGADIGGIAFIALAMYFALAHDLTPSSRAVLAGLCAGLAFGFKSLHLVSIAFLAGLMVWQGLRAAGVGIAVYRGTLFFAAVLLTAGFWLIRNYVDYGNPLYPVNLPLVTEWLGWTKAFDVDFSSRHATQFEWVRAPAEWLVYPWVEWHRYGQNFKHSSGMGPFIAASVPVAMLAVTVTMPRRDLAGRRERAVLLLASLFVLAVWWLLDDRQPRYLFSALVFPMPLVAWAVSRTDKPWRAVYDGLLGACVLVGLTIFVSIQALQFGDRIIYARQLARDQFYEYPGLIDTLPAGTTILNLADRTWHYPLAGKRLSNRVISMPEGRRMFGLAPNMSPPQLVQLHSAPLRAAGITHLFVDGALLHGDECLILEEVQRVERNAGNGKMLGHPRRLIALRYSDGAAGADGLACAAAPPAGAEPPARVSAAAEPTQAGVQQLAAARHAPD